MKISYKIGFLITAFIISCHTDARLVAEDNEHILQAGKNAKLAGEALQRCHQYVKGWLQFADPETGLIPRNLSKNKDIWNAKDAAADNYPFMVLTTAFTDRDMFEGIMLDMLRTEERLTSRIDNLPDTYSFSKRKFEHTTVDIDRLIFGGSEYVKDGLLPLTEWLGKSYWSERMIKIVNDIWAHAPYSTPFGKIPSEKYEVNGEMLQVLSRLYWMTGHEKYLIWAYRLADYYLLYRNLLTSNTELRLRDHGCEIVAGLSEIYATTHFVAPERKQLYYQPIHQLFDRILDDGRNEHGMLYNWFNPQTREHDDKICDTWGYNYNAFYTIYMIDSTENYHRAVQHVLSNLNRYYNEYDWERGSADGYADAIEGAINLYNREPNLSVANWIDGQINIMWNKQKPSGIIEGWHGDGNFARTSIMYALWKTKGMWIEPWHKDVQIGAEMHEDRLYITLWANKPWCGKLRFDIQRHQQYLNLPLDYPRINQFSEWFTLNPDSKYRIDSNYPFLTGKISGRKLLDGFPIELESEVKIWLLLEREH